jgi:hypothetical protein
MSRNRPRLPEGAAVAAVATGASASTAPPHATLAPTRGHPRRLHPAHVPCAQQEGHRQHDQGAGVLPHRKPLSFVSVKPYPGWMFAVPKARPTTPLESDDRAVAEAAPKITWAVGSIGDLVFQS